MEPHKLYYEKVSGNLLKEFKKRNMDAGYFDNRRDLLDYLTGLIPEKAVVSWGGSMTLKDTGVIEFLKSGKYKTFDRDSAKDAAELRKVFVDSLSSDYYFMSSNAVTMDGKLVNIDATGNRVAALCYGPENVIVIAGMNKVVRDETAALDRVKNYTCPLNTLRLSKNTPCSKSGKCSHCLGPESICSITVVTRKSQINGRIKVLLVGEDLGF